MLERRPANTTEGQSQPRPADGGLPAIVVKAQEDARCRLALAQLGYTNVRSAYRRHKRAGKITFEGLGSEFLWPTMDLVRDWLYAEQARIIARARWPFLMAMSATIVAGLAFATVAAMLG